MFYLSVPQEALLDVALSLADGTQTKCGWNRIIIEKPFGFDAISSQRITHSLQSKFEESQIYRYISSFIFCLLLKFALYSSMILFFSIQN